MIDKRIPLPIPAERFVEGRCITCKYWDGPTVMDDTSITDMIETLKDQGIDTPDWMSYYHTERTVGADMLAAECRRYPPSLSDVAGPLFFEWPETREIHWCGEWSPKGEAAKAVRANARLRPEKFPLRLLAHNYKPSQRTVEKLESLGLNTVADILKIGRVEFIEYFDGLNTSDIAFIMNSFESLGFVWTDYAPERYEP